MSLLIIPDFITEEIIILSAFNSKQEFQINEFQRNLDKHIEVAEVERWQQHYAGDEGEAYIDQIEQIAGISDEEYNVREMFLEVMPLYQRQAMLLTLWGAFECEMEKMCIAVSSLSNKSYKIPKKPRSISKVNHLLCELKNHGIPENPSSKFVQFIEILDSEVRLVRNAWAHDGGVDRKNKLPNTVPGITRVNSQLAISKEYIDKVIELMSHIALELNASARPLFIAANQASQPTPKTGAAEL